jgi:dUTP pyrophosphatase
LKEIEIKIINKKFIEKFGLPSHATKGSAGMDLRACISQPQTIKASETQLIPTGISIYVKDSNLAAIILPRSGLGHKHGLVLGNLVGLIDSDYQGELFVSCWNRGNKDYTVQVGERIAQLVIIPIIQAQFTVVETFTQTDRGEGGFGHSGK